jgi:hypothetical protein
MLQKNYMEKKQKKYFLFSCIRPSLSNIENFILSFHRTKIQKYVLACILALITSSLKFEN